jgi:hypothetical protein
MTDDIQQRIDRLERDKRWWRRVAIGLMISFVVVAISLAMIARTAIMRAHEQELVARMEAERARDEEMRQRDAVEAALMRQQLRIEAEKKKR